MAYFQFLKLFVYICDTVRVQNPHSALGLHHDVIRLYRPGWHEAFIEFQGKIVQAFPVGDGFFEYAVPKGTKPSDYRVFHTSGLLAHDPYAFWPTFGEVDQYLFNQGVHYNLYEKMGARLHTEDGVKGVKFAVWAPNARFVSLIADFNCWNPEANPMRLVGDCGVYELFVPGIGEGHRYKFHIIGEYGQVRVKADPYALSSELRPQTASVVAEVDRFHWTDHHYKPKKGPINVYEVHLGSWRKNHGYFKNYRELAHELADYCVDLGFTHVELMPIMEHPFDGSWGYQVTGFFATTSRYGTPEDFQYFVNHLHEKGLGVILDWVPAHFPSDDFALRTFDGSCLYEHRDDRQGYHPHWATHIFNYGRHEVSNFLIASALFWFDKMHIDGLRVDAVASMIYLDYGREHGQWIPNQWGGKENVEALEFLRHLNSIVHKRFPRALMIAEESTSFLGITHPLEQGGLGFDLKWNMGWMNDTLKYIEQDSLFRSYHHNQLTFGLLYAFSERFLLPFSHDEVVHGKRSMLAKMPGDVWQKFANLRLLLSYMYCQPGKKLLFMGAEIGQWNEWNAAGELDWNLLGFLPHGGVHQCVKELGALYRESPALWERDFTYEGFEWIDFHDVSNSVISYRRKAAAQEYICVHNFTPNYHGHYIVRTAGEAVEVFCSDAERYGGSGKENHKISYCPEGMVIQVAPLATHIFKICPKKIT